MRQFNVCEKTFTFADENVQRAAPDTQFWLYKDLEDVRAMLEHDGWRFPTKNELKLLVAVLEFKKDKTLTGEELAEMLGLNFCGRMISHGAIQLDDSDTTNYWAYWEEDGEGHYGYLKLPANSAASFIEVSPPNSTGYDFDTEDDLAAPALEFAGCVRLIKVR